MLSGPQVVPMQLKFRTTAVGQLLLNFAVDWNLLQREFLKPWCLNPTPIYKFNKHGIRRGVRILKHALGNQNARGMY